MVLPMSASSSEYDTAPYPTALIVAACVPLVALLVVIVHHQRTGVVDPVTASGPTSPPELTRACLTYFRSLAPACAVVTAVLVRWRRAYQRACVAVRARCCE